QRGLTLAGAAGAALAGLPSTTASAQAPAGSVRRSDRYDDSFIFERKAFRWPGNATLAIWIAPNVEVWRYDSPGGQAISPNERSVVPLEEERALIQAALKTIEQATGSRPRGWLGPGLTETYNTLDLLAEEGVIYCGDWNSDDQPYPMKVRMGVMFSIPYCMEINDIPLFIRKGYTGEQYLQSLVDQFDPLYVDRAKQPRLLGIPLNLLITGQPLV